MSDSQEFHNLLYGKTKSIRLTLIPDVQKYADYNEKSLSKNPLCNFRVDKLYACQVHEMLEKMAAKTKIKLYTKVSERKEVLRCRLDPPQGFYFQKMREYAEKLPTPGLASDWEKNILSLVKKNQQDKYPQLVQRYMADTKEMYYQEVHELGLRQIIAMSCTCENPDTVITPLKFKGRTEHRQRFLHNRCLIFQKYYLPHKLLRNIVVKAYHLLPELICDFGRYHSLGFIDPTRFNSLIDYDLKRGTIIVTQTYYKEIAQLVAQPRYIHDVPPKAVKPFLLCATRLLSQQIINRMITTIEHLLATLENWQTLPLLKLKLLCERNDLFIYPLIADLYSTYHNLIDGIAHVADHLPTFESLLNINAEQEFIPVVLPDWYLEDSHRRLDNILKTVFGPLNSHVDSLIVHFGVVYDPETRLSIVDYVTEGHDFEDCCAKVEDFNRFVRDINGMVKNEYFFVGKLTQTEAKLGLKAYTYDVRELIIGELIKRHRNYNLEICNQFATLKERALSTPGNTAELLALGEYMIHAATTLMEELKEKIVISLHMLAALIEMTTLAKDHIELNNVTINWLKRVKLIFEQNSSIFEQMKFDTEERLQRQISLLNADVDLMFPRLVIMEDMDDINRVFEYMEDLRKLVRGLDRMDKRAEWINNEEGLFKFPQTSYPRVKELKDIILPYYMLMYRARQWQRDVGVWLDGPFEYLDSNLIESKTTDYFTDFTKINKTYKTKIKMQIAINYQYRFSGSVDDPDPMQQPTPNKLCYQLLEDVKWFKNYVPLASCFCNPTLRQRHWDDMSEIAGFDLTPNAGTSLRKMINMDLMGDLPRYEIITTSATKELALQELLAKMTHDWDDVVFPVMKFKDSGVDILTSLDDIQALLEDHIAKTQAMRGSAFAKPIEAEVKVFYDLIIRIQKTIDEWTKVQVQWMYLLPIFSSKDIVDQLPEEGILFSEVDGTFRRAMLAVGKEPHVREMAGSIGLYEAMKEANEQMDKVNEGVSNYLEKKRLFFPRFFFLSNDDMLEILSETKDPLRVQPHLRKCFEGIAKLGFNSELEIYSMISDDREEIKVQDIISTSAARGCVERWLVQVEEQMVKSIKHEVFMSILDYEVNERVYWVRVWPGMVVLCVSQIYWSIEVQNCLMTHRISSMESLHEKLKAQIIDMVNLVKGQLSKQNRTTLTALITIDVHAQDVVKLLIEKQIVTETDFEWLAQLRYYWEDDVQVRIINATVKYAYEYLGNCTRLVITPLTDRCYRTLIGAYYLHLNGAPEGPAGTGKTETTKDLGRAIAVQCVVFNCSDGLDYKNMGKFFKGLSSCGAWACFDEFNRIELEVLSVVAQQILCIVQAVRANAEKFIFEGTELKLNPAVYVCITMNPGYAGRSELPDNLKVLFRTVAMMVPDYAMIGEISLYSSGFGTARILSVKIVTTYKLCSEQLSSQSHYDYGMRAVKTVLTAAQNNKLKFPNEDEMILLLRSIIDVNLPKFLAHDVPLFQGIITDLFPGVTLPTPNYEVFLNAVTKICERMNLQPVDAFLLKVIQTYEMMIVRHGFMLVGDPFGGKTSALHCLADTLTLMHEWGDENGLPTKYKTINPKSITMGQLYGQFDPVSSEWTDGVCAVAFREFVAEESPDRKWLIFDGPVDAVWIENLNTVLDDNKKLCLTSGEVMQMTSAMSMIFEVMDLLQASPATVSRCGMIYIEPHVMGWQPFFKSWMNKTSVTWRQGNEQVLNALFEWLLDPCLDFIRKKCKLATTAGQINQLISTIDLFEMFMDDAVEANPQDYYSFIVPWLQASMMQSMVWGAGGALDYDSRCKFNDFYISFWDNSNPDYPLPESVGDIVISIPGEGLIHDNYYTYKGKGAWKYFGDIAKSAKLVETQSIGQMVVPTIDTVKYQMLFLRHIKHRKRFLVYGETGTGKSFYIQDLLMNKLDEESYLPNFITFTPKTSANQTQELVISKLFKKRKGLYGPSSGAYCIVFVDDVNMPAKEVYGAQPPIELLRQFFDHEHWYDLKEPEKVRMFDTMFVAAMAPSGGSRQDIYYRFLRHFSLYTISTFSKESVFRIFSNVALVGLKRNGFTADIIVVVTLLVNATMEIFEAASKSLRPTPAKSHYLFNLRDFSRVITGCALIKKESVESKITFVRIWAHEILRVFGDRLIDNNDHKWLFEKIKDVVPSVLKESFDNVFAHLPKFDEELTEESLHDLIFGNFMDLDATPDDKRYEEIPSLEEYKAVALLCLEEYNTTHKSTIDIVLFRYALEHLARICRILAIPCGSLLMVGVGGSGRQSLTRLASGIGGHGLFQPEIGVAYGMPEWREDIKKVLKNSGGVGKDLVFLFTESQIKEEGFLEDIDGLLNSGEVPNLFSIEEKQEIIEMTRLAAQGGNRNLDVSLLSVMAYFVNRCKEKLHIMLCFSPIGDAFRIRLRLYPSLVNCCTIDWFEMWPEDALEQVAARYMTFVDVDETIKVNSIVACKYFHLCAKENSVQFYSACGRKTYITSAAFLDLIKSFADLMTQKQAEISLARDRYLGGLDKLDFAASQVTKMGTTLLALKPQLEASAKLTTKTMQQIESENLTVAQATMLVKKDEDAANTQAEIAGALKKECEADLAEALPILNEAIAALNTIKPADITIVKTMKNPPEVIKLVLAAVCVMMGIIPDRVNDPVTHRMVSDYWGPSKRLLGDMTFLARLKDYDRDNIPVSVMQVIKKTYMTDKSFEPNKVAKASSAAEGLCKWVRAMVLYDEVAKVVAPKKEKLAIAEKKFNDTMEFLKGRRQMLAELDAKLALLNENLQETLAKKIDLENQVTNCTNQLIRSEKLLSGLGGEKGRWIECAAKLQKSYDSLAGDILISCGMIAYLGPFTTTYRIENLEKWRIYVKSLDIPTSDTYSFVGVLGSEIKINSWNIYGLPRDSFSTENAIIMDSSKRWSLFIDPQSQANKWIRAMEKSNELEIIKLSDKTYMNILEDCIETGKPVLLENVGEELSTPLDPILMKSIYKFSGIWYITLGEKSVQYDLKFRFYITTKLRNPHYLPEVFNKVTLINFALTIEGLEDQLLGIVVAKERADLQKKREYLIVESAANRKALQQVEENILKTLSSSGANILEDEEAIEILDSSKILSVDIMRKQKAAKETEAKIEVFRQSYRPIAKHSSALYYTVTDLPSVDPMYQYSLAWFINLYIMSIETASKSKVLEKRLMFLRDTFTYNLYQNVCRSLFEKDKVLYSFVLYSTILVATNEITKEELSFFLSGGIGLANTVKNPTNWLLDKSWDEMCRADDTLPPFRGFLDDFRANVTAWKKFYDLMNPQDAPIPQPWEQKLTAFQKLIVMRMIRPDKVTAKVTQFVDGGMGTKFVTPPPFDIAKSYSDSNSLIPLIFILSAGSDPMGALSKFAENMNYASRFSSISLGQGQGPVAQRIIEQGQNEGMWVCLQNCHLAVSWMPQLEKICENFDSKNTSLNFRLWLTSYPSDKFPITVLQNGVKMTNEPPSGLQQNLMRSYLTEPVKDPEFFSGCPGKEKDFTKLLYALCFFHAVVQERRKFGAQGWNIKYGFNESDFQISVQQLQIFINEYDEVPFKAITYLTGECNYGGRVTDDRDRRCLNTILDDFYNPNVITNSNYTFADIGPEYVLPRKYEYRDYIKQIEEIPVISPPEVFGLHMNAGITRDLEVSKNFFTALIQIQGTVSVGDTAKQDEMLLSIKRDIYDRMPELFDIEEAQKKYPVSYYESMNTVLIQEMERYNKLLKEIRVSMTLLEKAVKGLIVMTPSLEVLAKQILISKIPTNWEKASAYPSLKPLSSFVNDFLERIEFFQQWLNNGKPASFWISGFSFVHGFLTGATQNYARKHKISIDKIDFDFEVLPTHEARSAPNDGVYVYGMFLAGARWDMQNMILAESFPKILSDALPIVWFKPCEAAKRVTGSRYLCPLYITSARFGVLKTTGHSTNYVLSILLNTQKGVSHWIKRGLALLCQLDD